MARGGDRPGSGRPRKPAGTQQPKSKRSPRRNLTPLEHLLRIMNDTKRHRSGAIAWRSPQRLTCTSAPPIRSPAKRHSPSRRRPRARLKAATGRRSRAARAHQLIDNVIRSTPGSATDLTGVRRLSAVRADQSLSAVGHHPKRYRPRGDPRPP
jgi:hypothetical protein